jgi:hypothetical protein
VAQVSLAEDDDMIKAFPSDRADQPFGMPILPWRWHCHVWTAPADQGVFAVAAMVVGAVKSPACLRGD